MKRVLILGLMVIALAAVGQAQEMKTAIYLGGGMSMPMGPDMFKDGWDKGFSGGAAIGFKVSPNIEICASGYYNSFSANEDGLLDMALAAAGMSGLPDGAVFEFDGGDFSIFEFTGDFKYFFGPPSGGKLQPYVVGSIGTSAVKMKEAEVSLTYQGATESGTILEQSESAMIFGGGAGFNLNFSPTAGLWVEAKYMSASTEGEATKYLPIRGGLRFQFGK